MAQVYSTLFIEAELSNSSTGYDVPDGFLMIVRDINCFQPGAANDRAVYIANSATNIPVAYHLFTEAYENWQWQGRQVIPAGSGLSAAAAGDGVVFTRICGYLLTTP